jgi:hypothetical protein
MYGLTLFRLQKLHAVDVRTTGILAVGDTDVDILNDHFDGIRCNVEENRLGVAQKWVLRCCSMGMDSGK